MLVYSFFTIWIFRESTLKGPVCPSRTIYLMFKPLQRPLWRFGMAMNLPESQILNLRKLITCPGYGSYGCAEALSAFLSISIFCTEQRSTTWFGLQVVQNCRCSAFHQKCKTTLSVLQWEPEMHGLYSSFVSPQFPVLSNCSLYGMHSANDLLQGRSKPHVKSHMPRVRVELKTFRLWDWRAAYCANEAHSTDKTCEKKKNLYLKVSEIWRTICQSNNHTHPTSENSGCMCVL